MKSNIGRPPGSTDQLTISGRPAWMYWRFEPFDFRSASRPSRQAIASIIGPM